MADAPDLIMSAQANGVVADGDIGANADIEAASAGDTSTQRSTYEIDISTADDTSTLKYKILRLLPAEDNALGANARLEVCFNLHQFGQGAGVTAVHA